MKHHFNSRFLVAAKLKEEEVGLILQVGDHHSVVVVSEYATEI